MSKPPLPALTPAEAVAKALNEQGFLLHHKVLSVLQTAARSDQWQEAWELEAFELPVSLPNHDETRIDLVLRHKKSALPWWVVVECKRALSDYKRWVFFAQNHVAQNPSPGRYYIEAARMVGTWTEAVQPEPPMSHGLESRAAAPGCPVYDFGIEARLNPPEKGKRVSATEAIEDACRQVTLGQAGLSLKLRAACLTFFNLIPVVVTTADLLSADFDVNQVSLPRGEIAAKDLKLAPRKWLAVNYRASDVICQFSRFTTLKKQTIAEHLTSRQVRTVFVVQAEHILEFFSWLEGHFPSN